MSQLGSTLTDLSINVAANVLAALILGIAALTVLTAYRSRGVKKFFGVPGSDAKMKIFLSTIAVKPGGTVGTAETIQGFYGDAITELEYRHALQFVTLLRGSSATWILTTLVGRNTGADQILSTIEKSPSFRHNSRNGHGEIEYDTVTISAKLREQDCTILIGGPIYNLLTHHILRAGVEDPRHQRRFFEFIRESDGEGKPVRGIRTLAGGAPEDWIRTPTQDYFVVSRIALDSGKRVFICAGTCTCATAAAIDQLANWRQYTEFKNRDFGVLYRLHLPNRDDARESEPSEATAIELLRTFSSKRP